jgi:hypothetical protein
VCSSSSAPHCPPGSPPTQGRAIMTGSSVSLRDGDLLHAAFASTLAAPFLVLICMVSIAIDGRNDSALCEHSQDPV